MINGAHSDSAIRGSFSIDNGDSSQYITFKIRVRNWFFGSKNQDFFPKQQFLFRDSRLLKSVIDKDLKKSRNKCFFHDSKLGTKTLRICVSGLGLEVNFSVHLQIFASKIFSTSKLVRPLANSFPLLWRHG